MASILVKLNIANLAAGFGALWLILSVAGPALAEDTAKEAQSKQSQSKDAGPKPADANAWAVNCSSDSAAGELQCQVSQNLTEAKTGQRVLTVTVRRDSANGSLAMLLALPHGLFLPSGVSYQVDSGKKVTIAIQTSDQNGAYAAVPVAPELAKAMKSGTTMNIGMESVTRKPVTIPVSLKGFGAAVAKLESIK